MNKKLKLLFVDDEALNCLIFNKSLEEYFTIVTTESAKEALQLLQENPEIADLVVSDYNMPHISGVSFLQEVKERWPDLPRYLHTAVASNSEIIQAQKQGTFIKIFPKPLDIAAFMEDIKNNPMLAAKAAEL